LYNSKKQKLLDVDPVVYESVVSLVWNNRFSLFVFPVVLGLENNWLLGSPKTTECSVDKFKEKGLRA
jgi:hypothetical protein